MNFLLRASCILFTPTAQLCHHIVHVRHWVQPGWIRGPSAELHLESRVQRLLPVGLSHGSHGHVCAESQCGELKIMRHPVLFSGRGSPSAVVLCVRAAPRSEDHLATSGSQQRTDGETQPESRELADACSHSPRQSSAQQVRRRRSLPCVQMGRPHLWIVLLLSCLKLLQ